MVKKYYGENESRKRRECWGEGVSILKKAIREGLTVEVNSGVKPKEDESV